MRNFTLFLCHLQHFKFQLRCFCHLEHVPVEDIVIGEALAVEQVAKQLPQIAAKKLIKIETFAANSYKKIYYDG